MGEGPDKPDGATEEPAASAATFDFDHEDAPWEELPTPPREQTAPMAFPHTRPAGTRTVVPSQPAISDIGASRTPDGLTWSPKQSADEAFSVPLQIPGYRIRRPLGHGGMGEVYLAERLGSAGVAVSCVIKTILPGQDQQERFKARFLNEARIVAGLSHPNIVGVYDVGESGGRLYMAMELVDGLDARDLMRSARRKGVDIPLRHAVYLLRESLQGLHHAHTAADEAGQPLHLVHRDLSPENLLLSRQGAVKITDFGVAKQVAPGSRGGLAGKVHYFAPELFRRGQATVQSDLFALGVTFYELLTVRPLFNRRLSFARVRDAILKFDVWDLLEQDLTCPEGLELVLERALAARPEDRYASALEFLEDVNDYVYESGIRLLDVHFAQYVERVLGESASDS